MSLEDKINNYFKDESDEEFFQKVPIRLQYNYVADDIKILVIVLSICALILNATLYYTVNSYYVLSNIILLFVVS